MNTISNMAFVARLARPISSQGMNVLSFLDKHIFVLLKVLTFMLSVYYMDHTSDAVVVSHPAQLSAFAPPSLKV